MMETVSEQKDVLAILALTAIGFIVLVASTSSAEYGLILMRQDRLIWSLTRLVPTIGWIAVACVALLIRGTVSWASSLVAFSISLIVASTVAAVFAPVGINTSALASTLVYYSLVSALLCITFRSTVAAGLAAPFFLALQVAADIAAHLGTGVIQIAC